MLSPAIFGQCFLLLLRDDVILQSVNAAARCSRSSPAKINLEIVSPGLTQFEGAVPSTASMIALTGPAFDVSIERLRGRLNESFIISHVYLYNDSVVDCVTFQNQVQDILAKWYSTEHDVNSMVAVITSGKLFC
ncbi:hypothetical protein BV898_09488 [Hypsibius exemplaris]|uniref:Uncharacterized protein n=1 Tax=Hypsibius exemplaris TaxID=2072580 RepID=A0A1W0WMJ3_HYPEX|nr:hypothetical protein BV898_09488 [Hypsibius exemplaris]